jgi:hypothetical protein
LEQELILAEEELQRLKQSGQSPSTSNSSRRTTPAPSSSPDVDMPALEFSNPPSNKSTASPPPLNNATQNAQPQLQPPPVSGNEASLLQGTNETKQNKPLVPDKPASGAPGIQVDPSLLEPPSVEFEPPLGKPKSSSRVRSPRPPETEEDSIRLGQIIIPELGQVRPASYEESPKKIAKPAVVDRKVTEIAFNTPLCRGNNSNEESGDDGIYLVLQPKNGAGEFVDEPADITVVAVDPALEGEEAKIGRWFISRSEAHSSMQPAGVSQGIHLSLLFQDKKPTSDRVIVYIRYELPNGLRAVNEHQIFINLKGKRSLWTPRVARTNESNPQ